MLKRAGTSVLVAEGLGGGSLARPMSRPRDTIPTGRCQPSSLFDTRNACQALEQAPESLPAMHLIVTGQAGIHFHEDIPVQTESGLNIGRSAGATDKKGRPKSAAPVPA